MLTGPGLSWPVALVGDGASTEFAEGRHRLGNLDVAVAVDERMGGIRISLELRNPGRDRVTLDRVGVRFDARPERVLEQGYQSWSVVRRCRVDDIRPERADHPRWLRAMYTADPDAAGRSVGGDQFLVADSGIVGFLDGRGHLGTIVADGASVTAWALLDGVALEPGDTRALGPVWCAAGDPGPLYSTFAAQWGAESGGRAGDAPPLGWCSWYQYFGDVTPEDVRANLRIAADRGVGLVQIDDGYQAAVGDWLDASEAWREGTSAVADDILSAGLTAGIWTAPFLAAEHSSLAADHPGWLARDHRDRPLRAMFNPDPWGGWAIALDASHPGCQEHLRSVFAALRAQGFAYHKIDFCFAGALANRADGQVTRAEALRAGLQAVRDGIGDDAFLLGCGCPFGPAVGLVDAMRVSPDVAPHWTGVLPLPGFEECVPAALNAVSAGALRAPLHRRVFLNDPDCLLLRDEQTELDERQREVLAAAVAGCGGALILSDDLALYGSSEWQQVADARSRQEHGDGPLDIADPFAPGVTVTSPCRAVRIDWRDPQRPEASCSWA